VDGGTRLSSRAFIASQKIIAVPHLIVMNEADTATITALLTISNTSTETAEGVLRGEAVDEATDLAMFSPPPTLPISLPPGRSSDAHLPHPSHAQTLALRSFRWIASFYTVDGQALQAA
jgi:hypothetical protein